MICLGIDSSALVCSAALYSDRDGLLGSFSLQNGLTHSQTLLPGIVRLLNESKIAVSDLDCIAVAAGPGSFTGLRIGISTAKGLAFADRIPCCAVSTLEALAQNAVELPQNTVICAIMDARREEYYNAFFQVDGGALKRLTPDRAITADRLQSECGAFDSPILVGEGAEKFCALYPAYSARLAPPVLRLQNAASTAFLGLCAAKEKRTIDCQHLSPVYLRLPQAEREWNRKHQNEK